jgi:hypothetical protein
MMATTDEYRQAHERCLNSARNASDRNLRQTWLELADSYQLLLMLDQVLASDGPFVASGP